MEQQQPEDNPPLTGWLWIPVREREYKHPSADGSVARTAAEERSDLIWECLTCGVRLPEVPVLHRCCLETQECPSST